MRFETATPIGAMQLHAPTTEVLRGLARKPRQNPWKQKPIEKGTNGWILEPSEDGAITARSFPRDGRIEGHYMGLGRPADPEHIGDTFL